MYPGCLSNQARTSRKAGLREIFPAGTSPEHERWNKKLLRPLIDARTVSHAACLESQVFLRARNISQFSNGALVLESAPTRGREDSCSHPAPGNRKYCVFPDSLRFETWTTPLERLLE